MWFWLHERFINRKLDSKTFIIFAKMKLSEKLIESVVSEVAGEEALPVARVLLKGKNLSEYQIATRMKKEVNPVRNALYKLYNANLVNFTRKKDRKKGWYIYFWTFNTKRIKAISEELRKRKLESYIERLKREESEIFFMCKNKCVRLDFDQASGFSYKCPECGELLEQEDNRKKIEELKKEIERLKKEKF